MIGSKRIGSRWGHAGCCLMVTPPIGQASKCEESMENPSLARKESGKFQTHLHSQHNTNLSQSFFLKRCLLTLYTIKFSLFSIMFPNLSTRETPSNLTPLLWPLWDCTPPQRGDLLSGRNKSAKDPAEFRIFFRYSNHPPSKIQDFEVIAILKENKSKVCLKTSFYIEASKIGWPCCCHSMCFPSKTGTQ